MFENFHILYNKSTRAEKEELFFPLKTILEENGKLCILEIGIGAGANLEFFPNTDKCYLIANDPNVHFKRVLKRNLQKQCSNIQVELNNDNAEDLKNVKSQSVDVVVCTLVCCSVGNVDKLLKEVLRVLVPGGKFLYLEHILDNPGTWTRWMQISIDYLKLWGTLFDNCSLTRNTQSAIKSAGFSEVKQKCFYIKTELYWSFKFIKPHLLGIATK